MQYVFSTCKKSGSNTSQAYNRLIFNLSSPPSQFSMWLFSKGFSTKNSVCFFFYRPTYHVIVLLLRCQKEMYHGVYYVTLLHT